MTNHILLIPLLCWLAAASGLPIRAEAPAMPPRNAAEGFLNVADFGAIGDGTMDCTAAEQNLEAFVFGRTDWEYVNNTFVFPAKVGYRFLESRRASWGGSCM